MFGPIFPTCGNVPVIGIASSADFMIREFAEHIKHLEDRLYSRLGTAEVERGLSFV